MKDTLDLFSIISVFCAVVAVVFLICNGIYWISEYPCRAKAEAQSMEYKYGMIMGCMVKYKGEWVDYGRLRYIGE